MMPSAFWRCTRLRYSDTCLAVPPASSMTIGCIARPPRPLLAYGAGSVPALMASTIRSAAFFAGTPNGPAAPPDRKVTMPSLYVDCAEAGAAAARAALAARAPTRVVSFLRLIACMSPPTRVKKGGQRAGGGGQGAAPAFAGRCAGLRG